MKRFDFRRTGKKTLILCAMALAIAVIAGCGYTTHSTVENAPTNSSSPVVTCSANPSSVVSGSSSQIVTKAVSPEGLPLTYTYSATEGSLQSQGQSATLATQGITGNVIVTCQAVDSKGNVGLFATTVAVQPAPVQPPPAISCSANPSTVVLGGSATITAVATSPEGRPLTYSWTASSGTISGSGNTATLNATGATGGTITVVCKVTDDQGLTASATTAVGVTTPASAPPTISCSANPSTVVVGGSATITAVATSPEGRPLTYSWTASSGTISGSGNTATLNATGTTAGTITVVCKVIDDQGLSASATTAVAVTTPASAPPTISCSANPSTVLLGGSATIIAVANSPEGRPLTYSWTASSGTIAGSGNTATLNTTGTTAGTITVICKVTDDQGLTASATTTVAVTTPASAPPTISCSANPSTVLLGGSATITALASSPEGRPLTYSWSASSGTVAGNGNIATLNTTGTIAGTVTVICKVTDSQGLTASATTVVAISAPVSQPPTVSCSANPSTVTLGGSVAVTAIGSSPEGRPLTYSWSVSSGTIAGNGSSATVNTSGAAAGTITVNCKVTDSQGLTASATTAIIVTAPASAPPTIRCSANPSTVTLGGSAAITAVASSPEGRPLTYSWTASSGTISGSGLTASLNTTGAAVGTITVNCTVTDNQGLTASATTAVTVNAAPTGSGIEPAQCVPPAITQPAPIASTPVSLVLPTATTINVMLDGATGDGHTNDSPAIQSIINSNPNAVIYFPVGQYVLDNPSLYDAGLVFSGFHGTAIMASGARFLCDTATTSAGQCIDIVNSSGANFDNFDVGYLDEQNLPLSRNNAISNAILVQDSSTINFGNTTVEASTGSGIWVTDSTNISFLGGTNVSNTAADGLHFENVGGATVVGYTSHNTGDDALSATNISTTTPNCGLNATNLQLYQSKSRGIAVAGACGSTFSNFYIEDTANSGLGIGEDPTISSLVPENSTFSNGTVVNAGQFPSTISSLKDCIDISLSNTTSVSNVECSNPLLDGLYVFDGANQVTITGVTTDTAGNVGFQSVDSTNVSLSNTVDRNSANAGYSIQNTQTGSLAGAGTCSSGAYGFYHSAATGFTESNLMSYDAAENASTHRVWWAENSSGQVSVNGFSILDDQAHTAPDVVGGAGDPSGSVTVDGITQNLLGSTLSLQLP